MNVVLQKQHFHNGQSFPAGTVLDLPDGCHEALVKAGHAKPYVEKPAKHNAPADQNVTVPQTK